MVMMTWHTDSVLIVTGPAGVGKSKIVLENAQKNGALLIKVCVCRVCCVVCVPGCVCVGDVCRVVFVMCVGLCL